MLIIVDETGSMLKCVHEWHALYIIFCVVSFDCRVDWFAGKLLLLYKAHRYTDDVGNIASHYDYIMLYLYWVPFLRVNILTQIYGCTLRLSDFRVMQKVRKSKPHVWNTEVVVVADRCPFSHAIFTPCFIIIFLFCFYFLKNNKKVSQ